MISASTRRPAGATRLVSIVTVWIVTVALAMLATLAASGTARAQAPLRMADQVVDAAGVFTQEDHTEITEAIDDLYSSRQIQMWVVYVDNFDGMTPAQWTDATENLSEFGDRDVVLAVATNDGAYRLSAPTAVDDLTQEEIDKIANDSLKPALQKKEWSRAAIDTIRGIDNAGDGESRILWVVGALVVVLLAVGGVAYVLTRRRQSDDDVDLTRVDESLTLDQLAEEPLDVLASWADEVLVATDNAVRTSTDELTLALDELDESAVAPFAKALIAAQQALTESFELSHGLVGDTLPDNEHRAKLIEIITACSDADARLDTQVDAFDTKRDLLVNADQRLDALAERIAETSARIAGTETTLAGLSDATDFPAIADNLALAGTHVQFADDSVGQGRDAAALPTGQRGPAGAAIRSAEAALDAADKLLDAIDIVDLTQAKVDDDVDTAEGKTQVAADFIDTRRGAVGVVARAELTMALRLDASAADLSDSDSAKASADAKQAARHADAALVAALADVAVWRTGQPADATSDPLVATALTGTLIDVVLPESSSADGANGNGNGYSTGGRSPGSFGGSSTGGRIGAGGRF